MKIIPAEGRAVRDPNTLRLVPPEGAIVPDDDPFWTRRVLDGDVSIVIDDPPAADPPPADQPPTGGA